MITNNNFHDTLDQVVQDDHDKDGRQMITNDNFHDTLDQVVQDDHDKETDDR